MPLLKAVKRIILKSIINKLIYLRFRCVMIEAFVNTAMNLFLKKAGNWLDG